jgi:hypothetical protein
MGWPLFNLDGQSFIIKDGLDGLGKLATIVFQDIMVCMEARKTSKPQST